MKYLKIYLSTLLFFISSAVFAQNQVTDSTATVVTYWEKGERTKLSYVQGKEKYKEGKLEEKTGSSSTIEVFVADATPKSYTIHWKYTDIKIDNPKTDALTAKLGKLYENLVIKFKTNEMGAFETLLNWKEIQTSIYKSIDLMGAELKSKEVTEALKHVKSIYATKESMEQLVIRDIQVYHTLYGGEYKLKEKLSSDMFVPNFLGGDPLPCVLSVEMTELKPSANYCKIQVNQVVDSVKASEVIRNWVVKVSKDKDAKTPVVKIDEHHEFEVELLTGWISRASYRRNVVADTSVTIETTEMRKL